MEGERRTLVRLQGIEGLRALAALLVLAHHVGIFVLTSEGQGVPMSEPVRVAVIDARGGLTLFFVLSGFLLHRPIASALLRGAPLPGVRAYARNRALRVLPAYWVALLLTAFALQTALIPGEGVGLLDDPAALLTSLFLMQGFSPETVTAGIGPAWSLAVEACFYLLLPLLGVLAARALARRGPGWRVQAALLPAAVLLVVGIAGKAAWALADDDLGRWAMPVAQSLPVHADLFAYGMAAAVIWQLVADGRMAVPATARGQLLVGAVVLAAGAALAGGRQGVHGGSPEDGVLGLACALLVLSVALPGSSRLTRALEWRWVVGAGLISYGVYLWHTPLIFLFSRWGMDAAGVPELALAGVVVAAATVAVSTLSYRLVERPALRYKRESAVAPATPGAPRASDAAVPAGAPVSSS